MAGWGLGVTGRAGPSTRATRHRGRPCAPGEGLSREAWGPQSAEDGAAGPCAWGRLFYTPRGSGRTARRHLGESWV